MLQLGKWVACNCLNLAAHACERTATTHQQEWSLDTASASIAGTESLDVSCLCAGVRCQRASWLSGWAGCLLHPPRSTSLKASINCALRFVHLQAY